MDKYLGLKSGAVRCSQFESYIESMKERGRGKSGSISNSCGEYMFARVAQL